MTLSKESLEFYATYSEGEIQAMARELLERRERDKQVPVALCDERTGSGGISKQPGFNDLPHGTPLYAAPPAPVATSEPVRYMNRFTGACYTLEQQPDAASDTAVYVPLYAETPAADIGNVRVGRLSTMNQDEYPGLGDWWVQLRIGENSEEVLARVYGATPQEASNRAEALACRAAMLQSFGNSEQLEPVSQPYKLVGEVVAWDHPTKERSLDFRWLNYDVAPGTQLYAILRESE